MSASPRSRRPTSSPSTSGGTRRVPNRPGRSPSLARPIRSSRPGRLFPVRGIRGPRWDDRSGRSVYHCAAPTSPRSGVLDFSTALWKTGGKVADNLWITQPTTVLPSSRCITAGTVHTHPRVLHTVDGCAQLCAKYRRLSVDSCGNVENYPGSSDVRRLPDREHRTMCIILCTNGHPVHKETAALWAVRFSTFPHD